MKFKNNKCVEINKADYDYIKSLWELNCARTVYNEVQKKYNLKSDDVAFNLANAVRCDYKYMKLVE